MAVILATSDLIKKRNILTINWRFNRIFYAARKRETLIFRLEK